MTNIDHDRDSQTEPLEQMKRKFLAAQQRRRECADAVTGPDDTNDAPRVAGRPDQDLTGMTAVRP